MKATAVIVEDDPGSIAVVLALLKCHPEVEVIGQARSLDEALVLIRKQEPDLLFLDIDVGGRNCFELLRSLKGHSMKVVLTSVHMGHGEDAIDTGVLAYLEKPLEQLPFSKAVLKAMLVQERERANGRLGLPSPQGYRVVDYADIECFETDGDGVLVHIVKADKATKIHRSLIELEDRLPAGSFARIHQTCIVNIAHVTLLGRLQGATDDESGAAGSVKLRSGRFMPVSRYFKSNIEKRLGKL